MPIGQEVQKVSFASGVFFQPATYLQMPHNCSTLSGTSAFFLRETISVHSTILCCYLFEVAFAFDTLSLIRVFFNRNSACAALEHLIFNHFSRKV